MLTCRCKKKMIDYTVSALNRFQSRHGSRGFRHAKGSWSTDGFSTSSDVFGGAVGVRFLLRPKNRRKQELL